MCSDRAVGMAWNNANPTDFSSPLNSTQALCYDSRCILHHPVPTNKFCN